MKSWGVAPWLAKKLSKKSTDPADLLEKSECRINLNIVVFNFPEPRLTVHPTSRKSLFLVLSLIKYLRPEMKTLVKYYTPEVVSDF